MEVTVTDCRFEIERKNLMPEWIRKLFAKLMDNQFYGSVTLSFEKGRIVRIKKEETFLPPKA